MATAAVSAHGTTISLGGTAVGEVLDISGPGMSLSLEDATNHDSSGWRENVPTILEGGDVSFDINFTAHASQVAVRTAMTARTKGAWVVTFPSAMGTASFSGYVTGFEYSAPVEGILRASVTISITGAITYA